MFARLNPRLAFLDRLAWPVLVAAACLVGLLLYVWPGGPTTRSNLPLTEPMLDEGTVLFDSLRVARGEVMYRDFFEFQGPVFYYLMGGLFALVGPSVSAARGLQIVLVSAGAGCLALVISRLLGRAAGAAAAATFAFLMVPFWPYAYPHWLALSLVFAALVCLTAPRPTVAVDRGAGVALGLAAATIQSVGLPALGGAVGTLAFCAVLGSDRSSLKRAGQVAGAAAVVLGLIVLYFASRGALAQFHHATLVWPFAHYGEGQKDAQGYAAFFDWHMNLHRPAPPPWRWVHFAGLALVAGLPIVGVAAAVATAGLGTWRHRQVAANRPSLIVAGVSGAGLLPLFLASLRVDLTHIAFVAALGVSAIAALGHMVSTLWRPARVLGAAALVAIGLCATVNHGRKTRLIVSQPGRAKRFSEAFWSKTPVARRIVQSTKPDDTIFVGYPLAGWVYWYTKRRPATAFTYVPIWDTAYGYFSEAMWQRLADQIDQRRPRLIWVVGPQWSWITKKRPALRALYRPREGFLWRED